MQNVFKLLLAITSIALANKKCQYNENMTADDYCFIDALYTKNINIYYVYQYLDNDSLYNAYIEVYSDRIAFVIDFNGVNSFESYNTYHVHMCNCDPKDITVKKVEELVEHYEKIGFPKNESK